ncbi:MAG: aldo/keto reductase, partial [Glaciihabitans sp.]
LVERADFEKELQGLCVKENVAVVPFYALASGFLTGKYRTKADLAANTRGREAAKYFNKRGLRVLAVLDDIAAAHGASTATVALAWLLTKPRVVAPVASASKAEQVPDLLAAATLRLSRQQVTELDRISAR